MDNNQVYGFLYTGLYYGYPENEILDNDNYRDLYNLSDLNYYNLNRVFNKKKGIRGLSSIPSKIEFLENNIFLLSNSWPPYTLNLESGVLTKISNNSFKPFASSISDTFSLREKHESNLPFNKEELKQINDIKSKVRVFSSELFVPFGENNFLYSNYGGEELIINNKFIKGTNLHECKSKFKNSSQYLCADILSFNDKELQLIVGGQMPLYKFTIDLSKSKLIKKEKLISKNEIIVTYAVKAVKSPEMHELLVNF